jgi:hypothetical protein
MNYFTRGALLLGALATVANGKCRNENVDYLCFRATSLETHDGTGRYQDNNLRFTLDWLNSNTSRNVIHSEYVDAPSFNLTANADNRFYYEYDRDWSYCRTFDYTTGQEPTDSDRYFLRVSVGVVVGTTAQADEYNTGIDRSLRSWSNRERFTFKQEFFNNSNYSASFDVWKINSPCYIINNATIKDRDDTERDYQLMFKLTSGRTPLYYWANGVRDSSSNVHVFDLIACPFKGNDQHMRYNITELPHNENFTMKYGGVPKTPGTNKIKLSDAYTWMGANETVIDEENLYFELRECPGDPYEAVVEAIQVAFIVVLSILGFFSLVVFAGALYNKFNKFDGMDAIRYFNVFWIFLEIYKFVSDLAFMILLSTRSKTMPFFVLVFLVTMGLYASNILYLAHLIEVWTHPSAPEHTRKWIEERKWYLYLMTIFLGGMHPALEIANSLLFPFPPFAMHVPYAEIMRVRSERSSTMVLENFPLMVLQFVYFLLVPDLQGADFIFWNAVTVSMLSAFVSTLYFFTKAEIEEKPIIATHSYHLKARGSFPDWMAHCHWNFQKSIALAIGVKPSQVLVEKLSVSGGVAEAQGRVIHDIEQQNTDSEETEQQLTTAIAIRSSAEAASNAPELLSAKLHLSGAPTVEFLNVTAMPGGDKPVYVRETSISRFFKQMRDQAIDVWERANVNDTTGAPPKDLQMSKVRSISDIHEQTGGDFDGEGEAGTTDDTATYGAETDGPRVVTSAAFEQVGSASPPPRPPQPPASPKVGGMPPPVPGSASPRGGGASRPPPRPPVPPASLYAE